MRPTGEGAGVRFRFGPFTLDLDTRRLTDAGREIHLAPKALELLATLVLDRPKVVSKAELLTRLWPETFVQEANLSNLIAEVRDALGDDARAPVYVRTTHGFGYAFCGAAVALPESRQAAVDRPWCWLEWDQRRFPLSTGENIIGRDPDVDVRLDGSTVSRRHARVVVRPESTLLEDCGSKNGTFRRGERVTSPVPLADGDAIHIGSLLVTFHMQAFLVSTDTNAWPSP
jgi:DNA-binding winged helix-turn-helix (wHTH) protein